MMLFSTAKKCSYRATDHEQTIDGKLDCKKSVSGLSVYKGFWHNSGWVLTCCRLMWQSLGWYFVQSHRCIVIVLSNSNWILFCLGMEHLIFSPSSNVCRMLSSFLAIVPYPPDRCSAFQNKPSHELNRVLGGSSEVVVYVAAWKVTSLSWAAWKGDKVRWLVLALFQKVIVLEIVASWVVGPEGCSLVLGGLCATCSISAGKFLVFWLNVAMAQNPTCAAKS